MVINNLKYATFHEVEFKKINIEVVQVTLFAVGKVAMKKHFKKSSSQQFFQKCLVLKLFLIGPTALRSLQTTKHSESAMRKLSPLLFISSNNFFTKFHYKTIAYVSTIAMLAVLNIKM
jgi:hypothetical protein